MDCSLDGKEYRSYEAAPVGCDDCKGCSSCCREMGDTVIQDPYDRSVVVYVEYEIGGRRKGVI